jgi:hypothetical protein
LTALKDSTQFDLKNHNNRGQKSSEWVEGPACAQKASTSKTFILFDRGLCLNVNFVCLNEPSGLKNKRQM